MLAMLADEKAARQKNLEKQYGFQGFLLCMRLKRALMKRGAKIIFYDLPVEDKARKIKWR